MNRFEHRSTSHLCVAQKSGTQLRKIKKIDKFFR